MVDEYNLISLILYHFTAFVVVIFGEQIGSYYFLIIVAMKKVSFICLHQKARIFKHMAKGETMDLFVFLDVPKLGFLDVLRDNSIYLTRPLSQNK